MQKDIHSIIFEPSQAAHQSILSPRRADDRSRLLHAQQNHTGAKLVEASAQAKSRLRNYSGPV
eukprot:1197649-Pleurochrysis_carterae.AAC.1